MRKPVTLIVNLNIELSIVDDVASLGGITVKVIMAVHVRNVCRYGWY
ncbi:MAG: hypothetical protein QXT13_10970 [Pyrobaculum sp.]